MSTTERQNTILNLLEQHRFLTVKRLSELTYTSPSSIRRDLSHPENLYFIKRSHGGASIADGMNHPANLMNRMKMNTSDVIINTKRTKSHIGMIYSDYATFFCDACENTVEKRRDSTLSNSYQMQFREVYSDLRKCGYNVDLVDERALGENVFGIKTLFVIRRDFLSDGERAAVERFIAYGGKVFECPVTIADVVCANRGYIEYSTPHDNYNLFCTAYELSQYDLEKPFARCDNPSLPCKRPTATGAKYSRIQTSRAKTNHKTSQSACPRT